MLDLIEMFTARLSEFGAYKAAVIIGFCFAVLLCVACVLCWVGQIGWAWLNDDEVNGRPNLLIKFIAFRVGGYREYNPKRPVDRYRSSDSGWNNGDGFLPFFLSLFGLFLLPLSVVLILDFMFFSLILVGFVGTAYLARFVIRTKKKLDKHIADPEAHKGE